MIESLVSVRLPADEELTIKKNRLTGVGARTASVSLSSPVSTATSWRVSMCATSL